jgi:hypothetical protein
MLSSWWNAFHMSMCFLLFAFAALPRQVPRVDPFFWLG